MVKHRQASHISAIVVTCHSHKRPKSEPDSSRDATPPSENSSSGGGPAAASQRTGRPSDSPSLARSITYQLLATKAANTIHQRVIDLCGGTVSPKTSIAAAGHANLRAVGLSNAKAAAMLDLADASERRTRTALSITGA